MDRRMVLAGGSALVLSAYAPLDRATLKRIPDSAHFIMIDQPDVFEAEVRAFLD